MTLDPALIEAPYALQSHLGFRMLDWSEGFARFDLPLAPHLMNRYGIPHGGIYATLLDTVMGYCGCFTGDPDRPQYAMTLSLTTQFLSRPKGTVLIAEACKTGGGRRTFFADGTIRDDTGQVIATGTATFRYRTQGVSCR